MFHGPVPEHVHPYPLRWTLNSYDSCTAQPLADERQYMWRIIVQYHGRMNQLQFDAPKFVSQLLAIG